MKKINQTGLVIVSLLAVLMYVKNKSNQPIQAVESDASFRIIEIVLEDNQNHLVPLTIKKACSTHLECINDALNMMTMDTEFLESTLPLHAEVLSIDCSDDCTADFSEEILEFDPAEQDKIEQVLSYVLNQFNIQKLTVNQKETKLKLHEPFLNRMNFIDYDTHQGNLYQMYMIKDDVMIPVLIRSKHSDYFQVLKDFYETSTSVQFDTVNFQSVDARMNDDIELYLSSEAIFIHEQLSDNVLPILFSLKHRFPDECVKLYVEDVFIEEIMLNEIQINEFKLSED